MAKTSMAAFMAEARTEFKWIKQGIEKMHTKQDKTNSRITTLENNQGSFLTVKRLLAIMGLVSVFAGFIIFIINTVPK